MRIYLLLLWLNSTDWASVLLAVEQSAQTLSLPREADRVEEGRPHAVAVVRRLQRARPGSGQVDLGWAHPTCAPSGGLDLPGLMSVSDVGKRTRTPLGLS